VLQQPTRIVLSGFEELLKGDTLLEKRAYAKSDLDHLRRRFVHSRTPSPGLALQSYSLTLTDIAAPETLAGSCGSREGTRICTGLSWLLKRS
jgi:hypothetical protein